MTNPKPAPRAAQPRRAPRAHAPRSAPGDDAAPTITRGRITGAGQRILLYGDAGAGKSTLAALLPTAVFLDLERGTKELDVHARLTLTTYNQVRAWLANPEIEQFESINIDSGTALQALTLRHVLSTKRIGNEAATSIEDYGYGKGYRHVFDDFALVLADLDRHAEAGRNVCLVSHAEATQAPNPKGADWLRWEPQLQNRKDCNIRNLVLQWADHVLFLGKDVNVDKEGRGHGGTTRTLHVTEEAIMLAKSRRLRDSMGVHEGDDTPWKELLK